MAQTVIALYDDFETARRVVESLVDAGFQRDNVSIIANDANGQYATYMDADDDDVSSDEGVGFGAIVGTLVGLGVALIPGIGPVLAAGPLAAVLMAGIGAAAGAVTGGVVAGMVDLGVPEDDAHAYAEGIRRGGVMVSVSTSEAEVSRAQDIMNGYNPVELDRRTETWREAGWAGYTAESAPYTPDMITTERDQYRTVDIGNKEHIDVVEEELRVGKRQVQGGGVRVRSYVTETPVREQVELRDETVRVDRHPVDRPASQADLNAFHEGVIEVSEKHEEAVISKTARVVEEVVISKDINTHTETVEDTVRRTDVEVEQMSGSAIPQRTTDYESFETFDNDFHKHYDMHFNNTGYSYTQFAPAYRYGHTLASTDRYHGYNWAQVEPEARKQWEDRNPGTWETFKDAISQGWNRLRNL